MTISGGSLLGIGILVFYAMAVLNAAAKPLLRHTKVHAANHPKLKTAIEKFARFLIKNHRLLGRIAAVLLAAHAGVQFFRFGASTTGAAAAALLVMQVILGAYGAKIKIRGGWLIAHRVIALLLPVAMFIHIF